MDQRVNVITLGVADVGVAREFYRGLGWEEAWRGGGGGSRTYQIAFFLVGGVVFALAERDGDVDVTDRGGWNGVTLTYMVEEAIDVEVVLAEARGGGARVVQPACRTERGGYCGVFVDPDGHTWEVLYDPDWDVVMRPASGPCG